MALTNYTFAQLITFVRASTKWVFNSAGVIASNASGSPAFAYDPASLVARGFSVEEAATNLIWPSADAATFFTAPTRATFPGTTTTGPDGASTMQKIQEDTSATTSHFVSRLFTPLNAQQNLTCEMWVKAAGRTQFLITMEDSNVLTNNVVGTFDLGAGTASAVGNGTGVAVGATITAYPNGIFKVSLTGKPTTNTSQVGMYVQVQLRNAGVNAYTGDGTSGIYVSGVSVKASTSPTSYIPTVSAAATRAADSAVLTTLSPWFNAPAGTVYAQARIPNAAPSDKRQVIVRFDDGTNNNVIELRNPAGTSSIEVLIVSAGATVFQQVGGTFTPGIAFQVAVSYASNAFGISVNGNTTISGTTGAIPSGISRCLLGSSDGAGVNALNGELQNINYYPLALVASDLQALT